MWGWAAAVSFIARDNWYGAEVVLLMQKGRSATIGVPGIGLDEMLSEAGKTAGWSFSPSCPLHYTTAS